jgi:hypothetical protein
MKNNGSPLGDNVEGEFKNNNENQEDYQFKFFKNDKFEKSRLIFVIVVNQR